VRLFLIALTTRVRAYSWRLFGSRRHSWPRIHCYFLKSSFCWYFLV